MRNHKTRTINLIIVSIILTQLLTGCGAKVAAHGKVYDTPDSSYRIITDVPGVSFAIPQEVSQATAITQISEHAEFDRNSSYAYKDGSERYILFNMSSVAILVQKGTNFHIKDAQDKEDAIQSAPINGAWLSKIGKKLSYTDSQDKNGTYKIIAAVDAQVSIKTDMFDDFRGYAAIYDDGENEYGMFIGAPVSIYDSLDKSIIEKFETSVKSLMPYTDNTPARVYDVTIGEEADEEPVIEQSVEEVVVEKFKEESETEEPEDSIVIEEPEDLSKEEPAEVLESEEQKQEASPPAGIVEHNINDTDKTQGLNLNSQFVPRQEQKVEYRESDIYSALDVGQGGYMDLYDGASIGRAKVKVNEVLDNDDVELIVAGYFLSGQSAYAGLPTVAEGNHWEGIRYTVEYDDVGMDAYVNVKFKGLDGEHMFYRGILYSQRTHDANYQAREYGTTRENMICFYSVPNGCKEYFLEIGEGTVENGLMSAYYYIKH